VPRIAAQLLARIGALRRRSGVTIEMLIAEASRATSAGNRHSSLTTVGGSVITLGVILLIIGFLAKIAILWTIGIILVVIGLILALLGMMGRAVGGRAHYY
jgi:hypothetical protein